MGPLTRRAYLATTDLEQRADMETAAHIHVSREMWARINELVKLLPDDACFEGRLPAPVVVLEIEGLRSVLFTSNGEWVGVMCLAEEGSPTLNLALCFYQKRGNHMRFSDTSFLGEPKENLLGLNEFQALVHMICNKADLLFSLMAEPRFIVQNPVSRLKRAMSGKATGRPALRHTWVKIGWTIGGSTTPKSTIAGSAPARPFHMVRAHWRNYFDRHTKSAEERPYRPGWWVWVEAYYSGNPALGEIKHHYRPKLEDPGKSSRVVHATIAARTAEKVCRHP